MSRAGDLVVNLRANTAAFDRKMRTSSRRVSSFSRATKAASGMLRTFGAGIGFYAVYRGISSMTRAAIIQERAEMDLAAALKLTGSLTASNIEEFKRYASELQSMTIYGDEATLAEMAYGKNLGITADRLKEATVAAMGLAAKYKIDLHSSMMLIGRAASGQTQMLTRYGIILDQTLSPQEKFNALMKIGADSFNLAKAATETTEGKLKQFSNTWGDLKEQVGIIALPGVLATTKALTDMNETLRIGSAWSDMDKNQRDRLAVPVSDKKAVDMAWQSYLTEQEHFYRIAETFSKTAVDAQWDKYMAAQKEWQQTVNLYNHQKLITAELKKQKKLYQEMFMSSFLGRALTRTIDKFRTLSGWSKESFFGRSLTGMMDKLKAGSKGKGDDDKGGGQFLSDYWKSAVSGALGMKGKEAERTATATEKTATATEKMEAHIAGMKEGTGLRFGI